MWFNKPQLLNQTRSVAVAGLGLVTMVMVTVHSLFITDTFPNQCSIPGANTQAVLSIGLLLITLMASLAAASATYHQIQPSSRWYKVTIWGLFIAAIPVLLLLPSSDSLLGATHTCPASTLFMYLTWIAMGIIALAGLLCLRLLLHERQNKETELELSKQTIITTQEKLNHLNGQKTEFVSIASHQLRSPLTSVRGYASMLLEESFGKLPQEAQGALQKIEESARDMAITIEDYLNLSRIEVSGLSYDFSDFNLVDEINRIGEDMRARILRDGLVLLIRSSLKGRSIVHADRNKVTQIIHNLLENAQMYTERGTITVFVRDNLSDKTIFVDVIDTGIGMSAEMTEVVFEKFVRADDAKRMNTTGSGLGLYVSQHMATAMGGKLTAHSDGKGKGSRFTLELPLVM